MANEMTDAGSPILTLKLDLEAAFETRGSSLSMDRAREWVLACRRSVRHALDSELHRALSQRGYDAGTLCAPEVTAALADVTACDLLQTISMSRKDAIIQVLHASLTGRIWCCGGEIIDAESGRLKGEPAVYRILGLEAGELCVDFRPVRRPRVIQGSTQNLMLEALRRKDECAVLRKQLGEAELVYSFAPAAIPSDRVVGSVESALLEAFTRGARIDTVLTNSSLGDLEVLSSLSALARRGWLVPSAEAPRPVRPPRVEVSVDERSTASLSANTRARRPTVASAALVAVLALGLSVVALLTVHGGADSEGPTPSMAGPEIAAADRVEPTGAVTNRGARSASEGSLATVTASLSARDSTPKPGAGPPFTFPLQVQVEPTRAAIWLDGERMATGALSMVLPRDGRTHELYLHAHGHRSQTLLFRDLSPPPVVILERQEEPETENGALHRTETTTSRAEPSSPRDAWAFSSTSHTRSRR